MEKWAAQELQYADLGDTRRKKRLISIVENLASQLSTSVPQASGNLAAASAAYDFWNSPYFHPSDIIAAQAKSTVERIKEHPIVLAVQDTTSLDFTTQKAKKGMGYLDCKTSFGLKVHTTLGVSAQGVPLGLINQYVWAREEKNLGIAKQRKKRETQEKESQRWLNSLSETRRAEYVHIAIWLFWLVTMLWTPGWGVLVNLAVGTAFNLPCLWVQRYNRLRLQHLLVLKGQGKTIC
ncbi:IS4/Tn5 family transposase DNA-binding protein [Microcystis aeruginosa]|uniref:Glycosyl-4,4'-diaponeurosporenoate acyltransferase n=1 Tax=Microcystis aeruginosa NIES-2521 TaxID=2303983 RepID=A0A5A5S017_MICAE|nr:transposase DNA-binding-containing protein [Microcystis aeruginosa]GCA78702.1 transposase for transposon Tn5 [Microcystis aeruginosa NIES-2521]